MQPCHVVSDDVRLHFTQCRQLEDGNGMLPLGGNFTNLGPNNSSLVSKGSMCTNMASSGLGGLYAGFLGGLCR